MVLRGYSRDCRVGETDEIYYRFRERFADLMSRLATGLKGLQSIKLSMHSCWCGLQSGGTLCKGIGSFCKVLFAYCRVINDFCKAAGGFCKVSFTFCRDSVTCCNGVCRSCKPVGNWCNFVGGYCKIDFEVKIIAGFSGFPLREKKNSFKIRTQQFFLQKSLS